jgi:hypothetical protein
MFELAQEFSQGNFTAALGDFDHDGDLDIYFGGNREIYRNDGRGTFEEVRVSGFSRIGTDPRGTALGDLDNDGDLDIVLVSKRGPNQIFRNEINDNNWLQVRLRGPSGQAGSFGAKVWVYEAGRLGDGQFVRGFREARAATGYCSQDSPILHFGLSAEHVYDVRVRFPNGVERVYQSVGTAQQIFVDATAAQTVKQK